MLPVAEKAGPMAQDMLDLQDFLHRMHFIGVELDADKKLNFERMSRLPAPPDATCGLFQVIRMHADHTRMARLAPNVVLLPQN